MAASLNPYLSALGEEYDAVKSSHYRLTIQLAPGGLSYALLDTQDNRIVALECYQSDLLADSNDLFLALERALEAKGLNNKSFHSVTCICDERINMLVPKPLFHPDDKETLLSFGFNVPAGYVTLSDELKSAAVVNAFAMPGALHHRMKARWQGITFRHSTSIFLESLPKTEKATIYINVRNRNFDIVVMKDKLLYFNNFRFNTKDDFVYFLLFAMKQNGRSGLDTPVHLTGLILPASDIIDLCARYVSDIRFAANPQDLQVSEALQDIPFQYYYNHYQEFRR